MRPPYFDKDTMTYHQPLDTPQDIAADVMHTLTADRDGKIRARLIELGWMPPDVTTLTHEALSEAVEASVRKGVSVHWDVLTPLLLRAHNAIAELKLVNK